MRFHHRCQPRQDLGGIPRRLGKLIGLIGRAGERFDSGLLIHLAILARAQRLRFVEHLLCLLAKLGRVLLLLGEPVDLVGGLLLFLGKPVGLVGFTYPTVDLIGEPL